MANHTKQLNTLVLTEKDWDTLMGLIESSELINPHLKKAITQFNKAALVDKPSADAIRTELRKACISANKDLGQIEGMKDW